ncbi:CG2540 [Drosophila busckii]|uniref:glutathione-specific gamma-glutamylcyclotransferase n=1 Tax=Drosophila busckii TaxID=30019 RepID=A0A0M4F8A9_DROBS|nr:putative glutathione-specific gamma-glutamylcyclotransferase 2 [Drosophila busckii]ALC48575.1 CG2540 [Drosophila busckii]
MMFRFVQGLSVGLSMDTNKLPAVAAHIYRQHFAELATSRYEPEPNSLFLESFDQQRSNQQQNIASTLQDVWIFGYGSLVWKADFPYIDRRRGYVCGYRRRFYQHSIDHRGVPEKPGRVVTLLPGDATVDRVYGVAYRIAASQKANVLDHLDYREKNGYERCKLEFHEYPTTTMPIEVIMYVATQGNDSYAGAVWQVPRIAKQIFTAAGPSGPNREYLFNLYMAMSVLFPDAVDEHLTELMHCVKRCIELEEPLLLERALCRRITVILNECLTEEQTLAQRLEGLQEECLQPGWRERLLSQELELDS